jgi:hypothetical protein
VIFLPHKITPCSERPIDDTIKATQTGCRFHFSRIVYSYKCSCGGSIVAVDGREQCLLNRGHDISTKHKDYIVGYLFECPVCGATEQRNY